MSEPQRMVLQFPPDAPPILQTICVYDETGELKFTYHVSPSHTLKFTIYTPDINATYTIDNKAKTLTTESDKPFIV